MIEADDPGGYGLLQTLVAGKTFVCTDVSSNIVVLKHLEEDCIHRGMLHPNIRERLARVRDLPHPRLATLRGVERWQGNPCLVWVYLDGETWEDALAKSIEPFALWASGLATAVDALHEGGIVHGNLHGRNVIVRQGGQVWLTHVSPYLYTDPAGDIDAVIRMIEPAIEHLPPAAANRARGLIEDVRRGQCGLRELARSISAPLADEAEVVPVIQSPRDRSYRISSLVYAAVIGMLGIGIWIGVQWYVARAATPRLTTFPSLKAENRSQP